MDNIKNQFAATCPKPKKEEEKVEGRTIILRSRDPSRERGGASQGGDTYKILKASWGKERW